MDYGSLLSLGNCMSTTMIAHRVPVHEHTQTRADACTPLRSSWPDLHCDSTHSLWQEHLGHMQAAGGDGSCRQEPQQRKTAGRLLVVTTTTA